jgi:hypothetical protein
MSLDAATRETNRLLREILLSIDKLGEEVRKLSSQPGGLPQKAPEPEARREQVSGQTLRLGAKRTPNQRY